MIDKKQTRSIFRNILGITLLIVVILGSNAQASTAADPVWQCSGIVSSSEMEPINNASLVLYGYKEFTPPDGDPTYRWIQLTSAVSAFDGSYNIASYLTGTFLEYRLEVTAPEYVGVEQAFNTNPTHNWNPVLVQDHWVCSGHVTMAGGSPLAGADVRVKNIDGTILDSDVTNSSGSYQLIVSSPSAQPGTTFTVEVDKYGFQTLARTTASKYGYYTEDFTPGCTVSHWYGHVQDSHGAAISGATVELQYTDGGAIASTTTDLTGKYDLVASVSSNPGGDPVKFVVIKQDYERYVMGMVWDSDVGDVEKFPVTLEDLNCWVLPDAGEVIFGTTAPNQFNFTYELDDPDIDNVKLFFGSMYMGQYPGHDGSSGTVQRDAHVVFEYSNDVNGPLTAYLKGYSASGNLLSSDSREFTFRKKVYENVSVLQSGDYNMGEQLFLILHDPNGDMSFSSYEEGTTMKWIEGTGGGHGISGGVKFEVKAGLFGTGGSTIGSIGVELDVGEDYEFSTEVTNIFGLQSHYAYGENENSFMGPGYGDVYYGFARHFNWEFAARNTSWWVYKDSDGFIALDLEYSEPRVYYGLENQGEAILSDAVAPDGWRNQNPHHNETLMANNVTLLNGGDTVTFSGGSLHRGESITEESETRKTSFSFEISAEIVNKFGGTVPFTEIGIEGEASIGGYLKTTGYKTETGTEWFKNSYQIWDGEGDDTIRHKIGIDEQWGTYIFINDPDDLGKTSNPWEYGTRDYLAPEFLSEPIIDIDNPTEDDSPLITIEISDEDSIDTATLWYSINNGISWYEQELVEQTNNAGTWQANIPAQEHGTVVSYFIEARDNTGNFATKLDPNGNYYSYTVINRAPEVTVTFPNGDISNRVLEGLVTITWSGYDPDDDPLTYDVAYSIYGTNSYVLLAQGISNAYFEWDVSGFPDTGLSVFVKVTAHDGFGETAVDESDYASEINNLDIPVVTVNQPLEGTEFNGGTVSITWGINDVDGVVSAFDLYYSMDAGTTWSLITAGLGPSARSLDWDTTSYITGNCTQVRVKVLAKYSTGDPGNPEGEVYDVSGVFTVNNPEPAAFTYIPVTFPTRYINAHEIETEYGPGYHVDTIGSSNYKYDFLAYIETDVVADSQGNIGFNGYFRQDDTFSSSLQPGRRKLQAYVLNTDGTAIISAASVLEYTDGTGWCYKSVTITGLTAGQSYKLGFGRRDGWSYDWKLVAEWAQIEIMT
ncbi:MAG: carboxypeptidase-like regulatory domain-containing protein [Candidatus Odinarchaeota archaeon]